MAFEFYTKIVLGLKKILRVKKDDIQLDNSIKEILPDTRSNLDENSTNNKVSEHLELKTESVQNQSNDNSVIESVELDNVVQFQASSIANFTPIITDVEWDTLLRNAQDGGANSVLACHVLKKTMEVLKLGSEQVGTMLKIADDVKNNTHQLQGLADEINGISMHSKFVTLNLSIELARLGSVGLALGPTAEEMKKLTNAVGGLTQNIEQRLLVIFDKTKVNEEMCAKVSDLFVKVNRELTQFHNLMLRIEELSTSQREKLQTMESKFKAQEKNLVKVS